MLIQTGYSSLFWNPCSFLVNLPDFSVITHFFIMLIDLESKPVNEIYSSHILQQTAYWGIVKNIQGWKTKAFDLAMDIQSDQEMSSHKHYDDLLITTKEIGDGASIAYVPYGPKTLPNHEQRGLVLEELSEGLRPLLPKNCILIRYDLPWESPWAKEKDFFNESGHWVGPPEPRIREFRMNYGTVNWNLRKAPTDILPSSTLFIDLNRSEQDLLKQMKPKTRYNINLAQRKGVKVRITDIEELQIIYALYCQTALRNKLTINNIEYLSSLIEAEKACMDAHAQVKILLAEINGEPLAGMIMAISAHRATYLFGASSSLSRNYMGTYALQWEAIKIAKKTGCTQYDMFGISQKPDPSHPLFGLYRFKTGFGGKIYHRQGCWDYPLNESSYSRFQVSELTATGYHLS
jgi:lipid II:glycine glycyltransferase (peptidoglycan interpeptide bridge formation enzyme)